METGAAVAGFRLVELLGRGAMGEVYRARSSEYEGDVALKLLDGALASDERFRQRFLRESEIAGSLVHPNVVRTLEAGEAEGRLFLAMELVGGRDLREILRSDGGFEPGRAVGLVEQAAGALDAAHAAGLVHRDVKPGNILVDGERAFVCDFGLARHVTSVSSLTGDRGFVGTIDYVPPEQIEGLPVDARADVYSLGCVLYECLTGLRPFERDSELATVFAHLNEPPPRPSEVRSELPAAFDEVVATALAKSPGERYGSCGELAAAARAALAGRVVRRRRSRRRLLVVGVAAAAVVGAIAAGAVLATTGGGSPKLPVTITPHSIRGARLGDSNVLLAKLWGGGQKLTMDTPGNYSVLTQRSRNVSAYFIGTTDKAVEITTWNKNDRTAEGIGPCSTLTDLRRAYGKRLKANPHSIAPDGSVSGWLVGKHMAFAMTGPRGHPDTVKTVALFDNDTASENFIGSNDGPCSAAAVNTPVRRPAPSALPKRTSLANHLVSNAFRPRVTLKSPPSWRVTADTPATFAARGPRQVEVGFEFDPRAVTSAGQAIPTVWMTATSLSNWLQKAHGDVVATNAQRFVEQFAYNAIEIDLRSGARRPLLTFANGAKPLVPPKPGVVERLYLVPTRIDTTQHTLAIVVTAPSRAAFAGQANDVDQMLRHFEIAAAPAGILSALSSQCTAVWRGTCIGELAPGTYTTKTFPPRLTYTVPLGWTNTGDSEGVFGLIPPNGDFNAVDIGKSDFINAVWPVANPLGCPDGHGNAKTVDALVKWLHGQPGIAPFTARAVQVGGLAGFVADLRMPPGYSKTCSWAHGAPEQAIIAGAADSDNNFNHSLDPPPMVMRLYLLRYKGGVLAIEIDDVTGDPVKLAEYTKVVKTFRFSRR